MKIVKNIFYFCSIVLIVLGGILKLNDSGGANSFLALGLLGTFIFYTTKLTHDLKKGRSDILKILLLSVIIMMSIIIFSKYLWYKFGDYPGLLVVPLFVITSMLYFFQCDKYDTKLVITTILYLLLSVPLFVTISFRSPRAYIPSEWYNRYQVRDGVEANLPYAFKFYETEKLNINATDLLKSKRYLEAITLYKQALVLEPNHPILLFGLSEAYARTNDLEQAITLLDTAIRIDSTNCGFYNNRGLLYYKLNNNEKAIKDYLKAIEIDSTQTTFYCNITLAYYYENDFIKACESIRKAEQYGLNIDDYREIKRIKRKHCD